MKLLKWLLLFIVVVIAIGTIPYLVAAAIVYAVFRLVGRREGRTHG